MCIICVEIAKGRMTSEEAYKAAGCGEITVEPEHAWDLIGTIETLRKKEESEVTDHDFDDFNAGD